MKRLINYAKPYFLHIAIAALASVGCSAASVWVIDILKRIIDVTISGNAASEVPKLMCMAAAVIAIGMLSNYFVVYSTGYFGASVLRDLRRDSVDRIMKTSPDIMEKNNFGDIMARVTSDIDGLAGYMKDYFKDCLYVPIIVAVFSVYLIGLNPILAVVCIAPLILLVPLSIKLLKPVKLSQFEYVKMVGLTNNNIQEACDGADVIKSYNLQRTMEEKYYRDLKKTFDISNVNDLRQYNVGPIVSMISEVPTTIALCVSAYLVFNGNMTIGMMVAFISAVKKLIEPLDSAYQLVVRSQMAMVSVERVFYVMDMPLEENEGKSDSSDKTLENTFSLKNVSFAYGGSGKTDNHKNVKAHENGNIDENVKSGISNIYALKNINLDIKRGKRTALVGRSGGGKSTVLKLLCGQYEATEGQVFYYDKCYGDISPAYLRQDMALISQDAVLFPMSVADNIRIGKPEASETEIIAAAKAAGCHEFISEMQDGYATVLEEKGCNLSGGQRQRISIARAILKDAPILLLDEPTSALDRETESTINKTIEAISGGKTIVTVAHRLTTVTDYDEIVVLENGSIAERGNHGQLMAQKGRYYEMFNEYTAGEA